MSLVEDGFYFVQILCRNFEKYSSKWELYVRILFLTLTRLQYVQYCMIDHEENKPGEKH